jgi:hypothetical protein
MADLKWQISQYCRMIKYWFKLLTSENCIWYNCYQDMYEKCCLRYNDKFNWACNIRDIFVLIPRCLVKTNV